MNNIYDVIIIGSGAAGMSCGIYLNRSNLNALIIDASSPGGQMLNTNTITNYPGFDNISGYDLTNNMYNQIKDKVKFSFSKVTDVKKEGDIFNVITEKEEFLCKYLVIATGRFPNKLKVDGEVKYIGKGVSYCAICDGMLYKDKDVAVVGGGNSAIEEAIYLSKICKSVTIIHRKNKFTADKILIDNLLSKDNVKVIYESNIIKINGNDDKVTSITLDSNKEINIDCLFIYIGSKPYISFISNLGIDNEYGYIITDKNMKTNVPNIYACGDAIKKDFYQIVTAASEGTIAALSIKNEFYKNNNQ